MKLNSGFLLLTKSMTLDVSISGYFHTNIDYVLNHQDPSSVPLWWVEFKINDKVYILKW